MKLPARLLPLFFLLLFFSSCTPEPATKELTVVSLNIRFNNPDDGINAWPDRIPLVELYMKETMPDIVGVQESLHEQNTDLLRIMPGYAYVGAGRDDGAESGEFSPVFYRKETFQLLEDSQFWLSETPNVPGSIGWEAVLPRIVTWAKLKHVKSGTVVFVFNTHYSHVSDLARRRSMEFMAEKIPEIAGDSPTIVMGDFNIRDDSELYEHMIQYLETNNGLRNARYLSQKPTEKTESTYNAFNNNFEGAVIDYIFVNDHFDVLTFEVDKVNVGDVFISDHWPVKATLRLK
ncbi:MAG: endonuclease/exonuclease/phosphatase family protein [Bacteroidota bacterium]